MFKKENRDLLIFSIVSAILFVMERIDMNGILNGIFAYAFIAVCGIFSIYSVFKMKESHFYIIGALFTMVAEVFLSLIENRELVHQEIGTVFFVVSQYGYFLFLTRKNPQKVLSIVRLVVTILIPVVMLMLPVGENYLLFSVTGIYIFNLILNFVQSLKIKDEYKFLPWGFLCFIICDILVGIEVGYQLGIVKLETEFWVYVIHVSNFLWIFYMLSQYFLAISLRLKKVTTL